MHHIYMLIKFRILHSFRTFHFQLASVMNLSFLVRDILNVKYNRVKSKANLLKNLDKVVYVIRHSSLMHRSTSFLS